MISLQQEMNKLPTKTKLSLERAREIRDELLRAWDKPSTIVNHGMYAHVIVMWRLESYIILSEERWHLLRRRMERDL